MDKEQLEELGRLLTMADQLRGYPKYSKMLLHVESRIAEINDEVTGEVKLRPAQPKPTPVQSVGGETNTAGQRTLSDGTTETAGAPATVKTLDNPEPVERRM